MAAFLAMTLVGAWRVLHRNALRSLLCVLGLSAGIGILVAIASIEAGARVVLDRQVKSMGDNVLTVLPWTSQSGGVRGRQGSLDTLTMADALAMKWNIGGLKEVCGMRQAPAQIVHGGRNWMTFVIGMNPGCFSVRDWEFLSGGGAFDQLDMDRAATVVLLGKTIADALSSNDEDLVGASVWIRGVSFRVIGILYPKGHDLDGDDQDNVAVIPFITAEKKLFRTRVSGTVDWILASAYHREEFPDIAGSIRDTLRARHRLSETRPDDFRIMTQSDVAVLQEELSRALKWLLIILVALAVMVGGVGVTNILLVSLAERVPEIGLCMAVGAKQWHIGVQFVMEAGIICAAGAVVGLLVGMAGAKLASAILGWPSATSGKTMVLSVLASTVGGVVCGVYPAIKASRLNPVDALRSD